MAIPTFYRIAGHHAVDSGRGRETKPHCCCPAPQAVVSNSESSVVFSVRAPAPLALAYGIQILANARQYSIGCLSMRRSIRTWAWES